MAHGAAREGARKTVQHVARAVERAGLEVAWVRRLVKRLTKLKPRRPAEERYARAPRNGRSADSAAGVPAST